MKYKATIKVLGKIYNAAGDTTREALANLKPENGKGMSILSISCGDKSKERILTSTQTFRLFNASPTMREIALKNTSLLFDI
jgi:hypothetical protein